MDERRSLTDISVQGDWKSDYSLALMEQNLEVRFQILEGWGGLCSPFVGTVRVRNDLEG